ncbi:MucBP domain-containing protein [Companilactobacillus keshanensis]|uniref:MucBP domain-containing protein n=1 Tax=Companilactobacillus keshanensis TaxID=2486003 RepID=A0ABW4BXP8_9LACO|nr:MucBP domain-containing protein [Companilactobacillus keshanensis]
MTDSLISQKIKKIHRNDVSITIRYIDSVGNPVSDSVTVEGHYLDKLDIPWKSIPGYVLSSIQHFQQSFIPSEEGISLIYAQQIAAPVIVYHRNINGELISNPQYLTGDLNKTYQAQPLDDAAKYLIKNQKSANGTFSNEVKEYEFVYNTASLENVDIPDNLFVQTLSNSNVFEKPNAPYALEKQLPYNTSWHVYKALKETYREIYWYNLGGSTWISSQENIKTLNIKNYTMTQKMLNTPLASNVDNISFTYQIIDSIDINKKVKILYYSDQNITAWETPYGDMNSKHYKGSQQVFVIRLIQLDNQSIWAQIDDGYYIESKYLNL